MPENSSDTLNLTPFWQWETASSADMPGYTGIPIDSIHPFRELPDTLFRESLVSGHNMPLHHDSLVARPDNVTPAWIFGMLLLLVSLISIYLKLRTIKLSHLLKSAIDLRAMDRLVRDCNLNRSNLMLPMGMLLVAAVCLPVHRTVFPQSGIPGYLALFGGVELLYILRNMLLKLLGNTFENKQGINLYIISNYIYHFIESMVVTILLFPFYYLPGSRNAVLYVIVGFLVFAFLWRFMRGVKVFLTHKNSSSFYLFYYLCIVEAIPVLVIIKWFFVQ